MIWITNKSAPVSVTGTIPFDTVVCNTNGNAQLVNNTVQISNVGWYNAAIQCVLSATDATTATVQLYQQGNAVSNAAMTVDIPAGGTAVVAFEWPVKVISAASGVAQINWAISTAVTVDSVSASVKKAV